MNDTAAPIVGDRHWVGNHEKDEKQQRAITQLMDQYGPSLAQPRHPHRQRADVKSREGPAHVGAARPPRDDAAHPDHPSRERDVLAPLPCGNPRTRKQRNREQYPEVGWIEEMLAAQAYDELGRDCRDDSGWLNPPVTGPQQQRDAERGDDCAAQRTGRPTRQAFAKILAGQAASEGQGDLRWTNTEVARPGAGTE